MAPPMRVLMVGLGPLGQAIARDVSARLDMQVVGAADPIHADRPLADLVPDAPPGVLVHASVESIDAEADAAIVATSSDLAAVAPTLEAVLGRTRTVVSTCEELLFPRLGHPELAHDLDACARRHDARLLGTGVNPGFVMDTLALCATCVCRAVRSIRIERRQNAADRRIPFQKKIGATLTPAQFHAGVREGWLRHVGLPESLHLVADALGWRVDTWSETIEPVIADAPMACGLGEIPAGACRGVHQIASAMVNGREALTLIFHAAIGEPDPADLIDLDADPPIHLAIHPNIHGDIATSAIAIHALHALVACPPGLHTMSTIPLPHFRSPALRAQGAPS